MFSSLSTAIGFEAVINSGKAILLHHHSHLALKTMTSCLCHAEKRWCRKAQGKFRSYVCIVVWHIWKKMLAWFVVLSSPGCLNYINFIHANCVTGVKTNKLCNCMALMLLTLGFLTLPDV